MFCKQGFHVLATVLSLKNSLTGYTEPRRGEEIRNISVLKLVGRHRGNINLQ